MLVSGRWGGTFLFIVTIPLSLSSVLFFIEVTTAGGTGRTRNQLHCRKANKRWVLAFLSPLMSKSPLASEFQVYGNFPGSADRKPFSSLHSMWFRSSRSKLLVTRRECYILGQVFVFLINTHKHTPTHKCANA